MYEAQPQDQHCNVPSIEHILNHHDSDLVYSHAYYYNNNVMYPVTQPTVGTAAFIPIAAQYNTFQGLDHENMQFSIISGESSDGHFQHYPRQFPSINAIEAISDEVLEQFSSNSSNGVRSEDIEYYQTQFSSSDEVVGQFSSSDEVVGQFSSNSSNGGCSDDIVEYYQLKCPSNNAVEVNTHEVLEHSPSNSTNVVSNDEVKKDSNTIFRCDPCGRVFKALGYLKQHNNSRHAGHLHKCSKCNKSFPTEEHLEVHFSKHSGRKPFLCDKCDKSFHHNSDLRRHYRLHTQNLFFCLTCGKGFSRKTHQEAHQRVHVNRNDHFKNKKDPKKMTEKKADGKKTTKRTEK